MPPIRKAPNAGAGTQVFLLSPAHVGGVRAKLLLNPLAKFALATEFRAKGLSLADIFAFTSGLYFRGKITYATHFANTTRGDMVRIITSNAGLVAPDTIVSPEEVAAYGATDIDVTDPAYHEPLRRDAQLLERRLGRKARVILLGSIATPKYRDVLLEVFGDRLFFPVDFVGRGDMSRGALLLRSVAADQELLYGKVKDAILTGKRAAGVGVKVVVRL